MSSPGQQATNQPQPPLQKFSRYRSVRQALSQSQQRPPSQSPSNPILSHDESRKESKSVSPSSETQNSRLKSIRNIRRHAPSLAALEGKAGSVEDLHESTASSGSSGEGPRRYVRGRSERDTGRKASIRHVVDDSPASQEEASRTTTTPPPPVEEKELWSRMRAGSDAIAPVNRAESKRAPKPLSSPPLPAPSASTAPLTAINSATRTVTIHHPPSNARFTLPITPATTARQLHYLATSHLSLPNIPDLFLAESFSPLNLERPIRQYERIRDILNSWDSDDANLLILRSQPKPQSEGSSTPNPLSPVAATPTGLSLQTAPSSPTLPKSKSETTTHSYKLHYSHRPSRWNKRTISLLPSGQLVHSANEKICHLSDFDVYTPTSTSSPPSTSTSSSTTAPSQFTKDVKPPRKFCVAVKSQQRSGIFEDKSSYVHFFCSGDGEVARGFWEDVHRWRGGYLWDALGDGGGGDEEGRQGKMVIVGGGGRGKRRSVSEGTAQRPGGEGGLPMRTETNVGRSGAGGIGERRMPPTSFPVGMGDMVGSSQLDTGRRQVTSHQRTASNGGGAGGAVPGRSIAMSTSARPGSAHGTGGGGGGDQLSKAPMTSARRPSSSRGSMDVPGPLVDLSPASGPPLYLSRRRPSLDISSAAPSISHVVPLLPQQRRPSITNSSGPALLNQPHVFTTPASLLKKISHAQGNATSGHGIASYSGEVDDLRDRGPLLDVKIRSEFEEGTLLRDVERRQGGGRAGDGVGPVIDRGRRIEGLVATGEGL